jgi:hypothetical protein
VNTLAYPCWGLTFASPISDVRGLATTLLDWRKGEDWLLVGGHSAISDLQLWTAWMGVASRSNNDIMRSHSLDAEFIRLIAGTHQIRIGFERAGLQEGDTKAWLIHIPSFTGFSGENLIWPEFHMSELDIEAERLMRVLDAKLLTQRPTPNSDTVSRLSLELGYNEDVGDFLAIERASLAHIALADLN